MGVQEPFIPLLQEGFFAKQSGKTERGEVSPPKISVGE